ncbi:MAG TPA: hypothetical protein PLD59_06300 [Tepidisphaeraceae bacterium]|nr:hypothetical protein [Tepidisphaeraceae bacterium]
MYNKLLFTTGLLAAASTVALAHDGPRVWLGNVNSKITTYTSDNDDQPSVYSTARVFIAAFDDLEGTYTTEFPGFELRRDGQSNIASGTIFDFTLAGPLLKLDGPGNRLAPTSALFNGNPPAPQLSVSLGAAQRTTNSGVLPGFSFFGSSPGEHAHLSFTLLGDGTTPSGGPDGVYVLPMLLTTSTLSRSDWFFLTLQNNNTIAQRVQAVGLAQRMADAPTGDANFDHTVNLDDFTALAASFGGAGKWWADGDFNFDGSVNLDDFTALASNFGLTLPAQAPRHDRAAAPASVPEPVGVLGVVLMSLLALRHRKAARSR